MERKNIITAPQLFSLLLLSSIIIGITYNLPMAKSNNMWDHVISAIIAFFVNIVFIFPIYKLYKLNPIMNIADNCAVNLKKIGIFFLIIYALYYLFACCYTLSLFNIFVRDVVNPDISLFMLSLCVILAASYAACKGIEGIARACTIILFIICVSIVFIIFTLLPQIDKMNYSPLLLNGVDDTINGSLYLLSLSFYIPLAVVIMPFAKGNLKRTLFIANAIIYILFIFVVIIVTGALGDYLKIQSFPIYTATSVAEIGVFKRLDSIYLGIFTSGLFITVSLFLFAFFLVMKRIFGEEKSKIIIISGDVLVLVISLILPKFKEVSYFFYDTNFIFIFTLLTAFVIPMIILIKHKLQVKEGIAK